MKVLVVEDQALSLELVSDLLTLAGYEVLQARDAATGLRLARRLRPALILMDINLPDMNGMEAIRRLKADPVTADIPVIALTALVMPGDRERILAAGADGYLSKPVDTTTFAASLADFLARREGEGEE